MGKRRNLIFISLLVFGTLLAVGVFFTEAQKVEDQPSVKTELPYTQKEETIPKNEKLEYISPDGEYILHVNQSTIENSKFLQTFYVTTQEDNTPVKIYQNESGQDGLIIVPENTFSPNDKYIFLKYKEGEITRYIALRTDGEDMALDNKTIEITHLFEEGYPEFVITDITGWGSYDLLVVNTDTTDGEIGPSWWFDVTNSRFTRLSTRFN